MFFIFILSLFPAYFCELVIEEKKESTENFKIHKGEPMIVFEMPAAEDATLDTFQSNSYCNVRQQFVQTETQQFTIIQPDDFKEYEFEDDTPLNFRQFIGMVHINDGMIAITSDAVAYLLKFNYDNVLQQSGFKTYGNDDDFAGIVWKADLQQVMPSLIARTEIPQLVYSRTSNLAFVLYSDSGQFFSVTQMEQNQQIIQVYQIANWIYREARGLTKEIDGYLFSSVGPAGLDIYKIVDLYVSFEVNVQFDAFGIFDKKILLKDFTILKEDADRYKLYLLDENIGLVLAYMTISANGITFEKVMNVDPVQGGIAIDTKNGNNVFAAFHQEGQYFYIEYYVDFATKTYFIITTKMSNYRILDVDATDEFAIISGVNHHQIVYENGYDFIAPHKEKILFTQIGMRDFEFFKYSYRETDLNSTKDIKQDQDYEYDDFFFGVTATNAFLTKFRFVPARVICFADYQNERKQYYSLHYNSTYLVQSQVSKDKVIRTTKNFTVEVVSTLLFQDQLRFVYILFLLLGVFLVIAMATIYYNFKLFNTEQANLDTEIRIVRTRATEMSVNNQLKMNDTVVAKQEE